MPRSDPFRGKHALITGGSLGIGYAIAHRFVQRGARVTLMARTHSRLLEARAALRDRVHDAHVEVVACDVRDEKAVTRAVAALDLDILVHSAGVTRPGRFLEVEPAMFRDIMEINYLATLPLTRLLLPRWIERGSGHLVHVGSMASVIGIYGFSAYAPSKFALHGLSECLRAELRPHGVQVTLLLPPDTDTPMHAEEQRWLPAETKAIAGSLRVLSADEVARALERGMEAGRFLVVPGADARWAERAARWVPGLTRAWLDWRQKRA